MKGQESEIEIDTERLLAVRLRLDGLKTRFDRLDRYDGEDLTGLTEELARRVRADALEMAMNGVERGFGGVVKALCLALDGTLPDDEDWYAAALTQLARTGRGRAPVLSAGLVRLLERASGEFPDIPVMDAGERLRIVDARRAAAREAWPLLEAAVRALEVPISPAPPDPDLIAEEQGRLERAAARRAAMRRAAPGGPLRVRPERAGARPVGPRHGGSGGDGAGGAAGALGDRRRDRGCGGGRARPAF